MARKAKTYAYANELKGYPEPDDRRSGCKVSWNIYTFRSKATLCAAAAKHNAVILANQGYDFGFQAPGSITTLDDGRFEVCIP
jgi:hypothetical protein